MMFASKTPRDLNHDPEPWRTQYGTRYPEGGWSFGERIEFTRDPRPEFDHVQHNEPNPILVEFRKYEDAHPLDTHRLYWLSAVDSGIAFGGYVEWDDPTNAFHSLTLATGPQIDHARKVLSRLARLEAGA